MQKKTGAMPGADILIAGGGIIGLSVALELRRRGAQVLVLERAAAGDRTPGQASWAAAGMLAARDPHNPIELSELALRSEAMYDDFLDRLRSWGAPAVRYQTTCTLQYGRDGESFELTERSLDPRELTAALEHATRAAGVRVLRGFTCEQVEDVAGGVRAVAANGAVAEGAVLVHAQGAWARAAGVAPRKGQMMRVRLELPCVHRAEDVYIVPRHYGAQAGTALLGASVEDAGFDLSVRPEVLAQLRARVESMVPGAAHAPVVEAWAGFRPATANGLPLLGALPDTERQWLACGHFRNGVLLAPATAEVIADLVEKKAPQVALNAFQPSLDLIAHAGR